ncbi:chorismate--pyruvate lyase family protein [Marinagarivorans algicola]|uniref:chorismate--pyruvate lyase family protein n=1 Tax=Marinagarivorans algicola TaxID=1513270 RepID=UPI0037360B77
MKVNSNELFCSSGYMPELIGLNWLALPAIIRVLLATDGTVTKSLESYFWEPIRVRCLKQQCLERQRTLQSTDESGPEIEIEKIQDPEGCTSESIWRAGDELWSRDVYLEGRHSQKRYVEASSIVCFSILPNSVRQGLLAGELGIGEIIRMLGLETYRRIVSLGQQPKAPAPPTSVWRVYHLYYKGRILMEIKEEFNLKAFV